MTTVITLRYFSHLESDGPFSFYTIISQLLHCMSLHWIAAFFKNIFTVE